MFIAEYNNGAPRTLVLLHGAGTGHWAWEDYPALLPDYHIFCPDLPGHGHSAETDFISIDESAEAVYREILASLSDRDVTVAGHSLGAQILLSLWSSHPESFSRAIVASALVIPQPAMLGWIGPAAAMTMPLIKSRIFSRLQAASLELPRNYFEEYYRDSLKLSKSSLENILRENMAFTLPGSLSPLPSRIVCGEREPGIMRKSAEMIHERVSGSGLDIVRKTGHGYPCSRPGELARIIDAIHAVD